MDNQKLASKKLPSIRTFALDQKNKTGESTEEEKPTEITPVVVATKQIPLPPKKEVLEKQTPTPIKKIPTPPVVRKEHIIADAPVPVKKTTLVPKATDLPAPPLKSPVKREATLVTIDNENSSSATIITDTKKDRFNFSSSVIKSIASWIEEFKANRKAKSIPKYTVPETTRRKGVIQKATSITGKFAVADHSLIHEKIRRRRELDERQTPSSSWSPNTESIFPLLEAENPSNVKMFPRKSFITKHQEIVITDLEKSKQDSRRSVDNEPDIQEEREVAEPVFPVDQEEILLPTGPTWDTADNHVDTENVVKEPIKISTPTIHKEEATKEMVSETHHVTETDIKTAVSLPQKKHEDIKQKRQKHSFLYTTTTNSLSFSIFIVMTASVVVGTYGYYWYASENRPVPVISMEYPQLINAPLTTIYLPNYTKESILSAIKTNEENQNENVTQFIFTSNKSVTPAIPPGTLLTKFGITLEVSFFESITNLYFGRVNNTYPFLALRVTDRTIAQGGMLAWEKNMHRDLSSILDLSSTSTEKFTDAMQSGIDVRILKNDVGADEIIYGFIDNNTIIITTNGTAMGKLSELAK